MRRFSAGLVALFFALFLVACDMTSSPQSPISDEQPDNVTEEMNSDGTTQALGGTESSSAIDTNLTVDGDSTTVSDPLEGQATDEEGEKTTSPSDATSVSKESTSGEKKSTTSTAKKSTAPTKKTTSSPTKPVSTTQKNTTQKTIAASTSSSATPTTSHNHTWIKKTTQPPTCTEQGYTKIEYSCGKVEIQNYVEALGHAMSEWTTVVAATPTATGQSKRICTRCPYEESKEIPKLQLPNTTDPVKQQVLDLVNEHRRTAGLTELSYYTAEQAAADTRAKEIQTSFSHYRPNGEAFYTAFSGLGSAFFGCGENVAMNFQDAATVVQAWMDSPKHRENILDPDFDAMVIGVDNGYWAQLFIDF